MSKLHLAKFGSLQKPGDTFDMLLGRHASAELLASPYSDDPHELDNLQIGFNALSAAVTDINVANGFWDDRLRFLRSDDKAAWCFVIGDALAKAHGELSEADEAVRKMKDPSELRSLDKDSFTRELAGTIVRIMDIATMLELPLFKAIVAEAERNMTRGYKHGKNS